MRICKTCGEKFNFEQNMKSIFKRDGRVECERCNSVFVLKKENIFRWLLDFIYIFIVISISDEIGGIKGIIIALAIGLIVVFIDLNLDGRYILKNHR
ncbi:MAG: hypothetical protein Q3980_06295 [Turicibacter sp.]|nr:hypothetical protein [Turicibacter sp.]